MEMNTPAAEQLLRHRDFVLRLARRLVGGDRADDVAQETWLSVLRRPPRGGATRAWLATVTRNAARMLWRREGRRQQHERAQVTDRTDGSVPEALARAETQALVVNEVLALSEPYRTAVILRFFEDLPPREIARRTATNVHTARVRVRRALERLRGRLDAQHGGDRRAWSIALLPFLEWNRAKLAATATGALVMGKKTATVVVIWALVATGFYVREKVADPRPQERASRSSANSLPSSRGPEEAEASPSRSLTATEEHAAFKKRWLGSRTGALRGRVVGRSREPIPGVSKLKWTGTLPDKTEVEFATTTEPDGSFSAAGIRFPLAYRVTIEGDEIDTQTRTVFVTEDGVSVDLTVNLTPFVVGRVVHQGAPIAGARVLRMGFNPAITAEDGSFRIRLQPNRTQVELAAAAPGFWAAHVSATKKNAYRWEAEIELVPGPHLRATILNADGSPAANKTVTMHLERDFSDERPEYPNAGLTRVLMGSPQFANFMRGDQTTEIATRSFKTDAEGRVNTWFVFRATRAAMSVGDYKRNVFDVPGVSDRPDGVFDLGTIRLHEVPEPLRMRVVDADGAPMAGARVGAMGLSAAMQCRRSGMRGESDDQGEIESTNLLPGTNYKWWVTHKSRSRVFDAVAEHNGTLRVPK